MSDVYGKNVGGVTDKADPLLSDEQKGKLGDYNKNVSNNLIVFYVVMVIIWLVLVITLGVKPNDMVTIALILVPVIVFGIAIYNTYDFNRDQHNNKASVNLFTVALLSTSILVGWRKKGGSEVDKQQFYKLFITGFLLAMLSAMDIWTNRKDEVYVVHGKSAAQTMALSILMIALFWYYVDVTK